MPEIYLYRDPVDFRKSFRGLAAIVEQQLGHNPFDGALYAFTNRQRNTSRSEEVPARLLDGFEGVLQTDGYAGYNKVCRDNPIIRIGCWDHARRKFVEASKAAPRKKKGTQVSKADVAIGKIRKLYAIEERIKALEPAQKTVQRQQLSHRCWMTCMSGCGATALGCRKTA
jgi:hypothetical protein